MRSRTTPPRTVRAAHDVERVGDEPARRRARPSRDGSCAARRAAAPARSDRARACAGRRGRRASARGRVIRCTAAAASTSNSARSSGSGSVSRRNADIALGAATAALQRQLVHQVTGALGVEQPVGLVLAGDERRRVVGPSALDQPGPRRPQDTAVVVGLVEPARRAGRTSTPRWPRRPRSRPPGEELVVDRGAQRGEPQLERSPSPRRARARRHRPPNGHRARHRARRRRP